MERLPVDLLYKKGLFPTLDKKWDKYKRVQVFTGVGWDEALTQGEVDVLYKIYKMKRLKPNSLSFGELSTYVKLAEKVCDYRYRAKLEKARLRNHRSRKKLKEAAERGDLSAVKRYEGRKKSNRDNMAKKRNRKRKCPSSIKAADNSKDS